MDYRFKIEVSGNSPEQLKAIENAIRSVGTAHTEEMSKMKDGIQSMGNDLSRLKTQIIEAFAVEKVYEFGKKLLEVTAEFEGFDNVIKYSSLNATDAQKNMTFLKESIADLHIPMQQAYEGFSDMQAGLIGTGIEGQRLRDVFKGFETMATVRHMPEFTRQRAFYDMKEIAERGINQRSIMGLSGAGVPVAELIKEATGKSIEQLKKTMSGGEFILKLTQGMQEHYQAGLPNAVKSLQAQMTDASNALLEKMREMGEQLRPVYTEILKDIKGAFDSAPVKFFIENIKTIVDVGIKLGEVWLAYKGVMLAVSAGQAVYKGIEAAVLAIQIAQAAALRGTTIAKVRDMIATGELTEAELAYEASISETTAAMGALDIAMDANPIGAIVGGIALVTGAFLGLKTMIDDTKKANRSFMDEIHKDVETEKKGALEDIHNIVDRYRNGIKGFDKHGHGIKYTASEQEKNIAADMKKQLLLFEQTHLITMGDKTMPNYSYGDLQYVKMLKDYKGTLAAENKPETYSSFKDPDKGHKTGALSMVDMTGARGGLGEAKQIFINIHGPIQQNNGVKESAKEADHSVQLIMRAINNLSASQSQTY